MAQRAVQGASAARAFGELIREGAVRKPFRLGCLSRVMSEERMLS